MKIASLVTTACAITMAVGALGASSAVPAAAEMERAGSGAAPPRTTATSAPILLINGDRFFTANIPNGAGLTSPVPATGDGGPDAILQIVDRDGRLTGISPAARPASRSGLTHTLTVRGTNLEGKPDTGDSVVVANVDNVNLLGGFVGKVLHHGVARFTVPAGHYLVIGFFVARSGKKITSQHVVVLPQSTVSDDTTVSVAERSADSEVRMVTPRSASLLWATLDIYRETARRQLLDASAVSVGHGPLWVNPTSRRVRVGTLRTVTAAGLTSRPGSRAPYEYNLLYESANGLIPAQRRVVRPAQLAIVDTRYYQAVHSAGQLYMRGLLPFQGGIIFGGFFPVSLPSQVTEYVSGNPSVVWFNEYSQTRPSWTGGQLDAHRAYLAGQRVRQDWGAYPLHSAADVSVLGAADPWARFVPDGTVPSAARAGNTLLLEIDPFGDNQPGHVGGGYSAGSYQIDQNGKKIAAGNAVQRPGGWAFLKQVKLSPGPSVISFTLAAARTGTLGPGKSDTLSTASRTVWTWRSSHEAGVSLPLGWWCGVGPISRAGVGSRACAAEPMMTLRFAVQNLALDGAAPPGLQLVRIAVGHLQLARVAPVIHAAVQVSFNGGKTWHPARVVGRDGTYTALFTAPAGARVTLRTSAADAAGGSITETITSAYATASRSAA
jgi:hypothetical protein